MYQKMCFVGVSVWNDKKINGSHILPLKRTEEGNRGGCVLLSGIQYRKNPSPFFGIWKNDGVNVGNRSLFSFKICVYYACNDTRRKRGLTYV
jgi:hypothetical protein